jgi:hypothetical protein
MHTALTLLNIAISHMKLNLLLIITIAFLITSCKKDGKACWQAFDKSGGDATGLVICNKTKAEAEAMHPEFWFYKQGEAKYCWKVVTPNSTSYTWDVPESMAAKMQEFWGISYTKVDCKSFCFLEWYEKHKSKITGFYGPTYLKQEYLFSPDSCSKLSVGKVVVFRETSDSLITRELARKGP